MAVLRLKTIDGSKLNDKKILEWLYFSIDTHFIKEWYKNSEGYFVKLHNSDEFLKVEDDLI